MKFKSKKMLSVNPFILLLILFLYIIGYFIYPYLPDQVPSHWNIHGQVDDYNSKTFHVLFFPSITLWIYLFMAIIPILDPRSDNYKKFYGVFETFRLIMVLFFIILYAATSLYAMGYAISIGKVVRFSVGILMAILGNYFGKIKHNYTFGIKTPWTLASEEVWNKTHRATGPLFVIIGFVWMISVFLDDKISYIIGMAGLILVSLFSAVYSYVLFRRITKINE